MDEPAVPSVPVSGAVSRRRWSGRTLVVAIGDDDPNPVSLWVGPFTADKPVVTNWHSSAADAVPFS
ncbi:hypothetical protein [Streptomyces sp. 378]|uniref:hypothetical protein n=1 Tax=Streptomyces sp. 378 TaxID=3049412 RepID=UPI0024C31271|nr:hypothetical protein [Streptomyces sp. 378]